MLQPLRKAVFPVGGLGTRFLPATKALPKEMLPIVDKPLIQHAVDEARAAGIEKFIFVTGRGKTAIEDHFDYSYELEETLKRRGKQDILDQLHANMVSPGDVAYTRQQEPLGLGHAVWCARDLVGNEPFAVLLADDLVLGAVPCLKEMMAVYAQRGGNVVAVTETPADELNFYGVLATGEDDGYLAEVTGLVEKPKPDEAPSNLCLIGRYILNPLVFCHLSNHTAGAGGEIQLTDAMARMIGNMPFHGVRFGGRRYDCGKKLGFIQANIKYALSRDDLREELLEYIRAEIDVDVVTNQ